MFHYSVNYMVYYIKIVSLIEKNELKMRNILVLLAISIVYVYICSVFGLDRIDEMQVRSLNDTGIQFYNNKDYTQAITKFSEANTIDPHDYAVKTNLISSYLGRGIQLKNQGNLDQAAQMLHEALKLDDTIPETRLILASILFEQGDFVSAKGELEIARIYQPDNSAVTTMLGELYFQEGRWQEALDLWIKAQEREPYNTALADKIKRVQKEWDLLKSFKVKRSHPFSIKYKSHNEALASKVLSVLMKAYVDVGGRLNYFPLSEVIVIMYDPNDFFAATGARGSIASLYDGKIRVKVTPRFNDKKYLKEILYHEYTHVLVRFISNDSCPFWLNEGLAQVLSNSSASVDLDTLSNLELESDFFNLKNLETYHGLSKCIEHGIDMDMSIKLAYVKSLIATNYIVSNYGLRTATAILKDLKAKKTVADSIKKELGISLAEFDVIINETIYKGKEKILTILEKKKKDTDLKTPVSEKKPK